MSAAPKQIDKNHPFLNRDVIMNLSAGVSETLKTMGNLESSFDKPFVEKNWKTPNDVTVLLDLKSEPFTGQLRVHFDRKCVVLLLDKFSGVTVEESAPEILDCVGEISNMCYGYAKSKLNQVGLNLQMSIPKPMPSSEAPEVVSPHPHMVLPFKIENHQCYIQIIIQPAD
jgi:chemotaxis protein CheX